MSLLKLLSKQSGGNGGEGGEPLPILADAERPENIAEKIESVLDQVESLSSEELDMLDPKGENHEVEQEKTDDQQASHKELNKLKVAEDLVDPNKATMLDVSRKLDQISKLQARRQVKEKPDPAGDEVRQRPIRNLGELPRISQTAWAMRQRSPTLFLYRTVTNQLPVRERITRNEYKQAIYILLDGSGSMKSGKKHWKATGVVMHELKAVLSGDAVVWVCVFDTTLAKVHFAGTPDEARKLIKEFADGNFTGGSTDIAGSIKAAHKYMADEIAKGAMLYKPEVLVLTDEDSSAGNIKKSDVPGTTVHGFAMEVKNPLLVAFARSTGGVGIENF